MLVITGATGNIGSKAVELLCGQGEKVRVIGRDALHLQHLVKIGAEAAVGTLEDQDFVTAAFKDAEAVFAMIPPHYTAVDFRAYQNRVGSSIAKAIERNGIRYVVNLSSQGADLVDGTGPIAGLRDQEERLNMIEGVNVLHLRPTYFMENLLMTIPVIHQTGVAGTALRGDMPFAMIATKDIAAVVARRLVDRDFSGKQVLDLLGQRDVSLAEVTTLLGNRIDWPSLAYVQFSYKDAERGMLAMGMSQDVARLFIEMSVALNNRLFAVGRPRTAENTTPTSIEEFAETFAAAFEAARLKIAA